MITVAQYVDGLGTGGIESFVCNVFDHVDRQKYHFDFIVESPSMSPLVEFIEARAGRIIPLFKTQKKHSILHKFAKAKRFCETIRLGKYDVVHVHVSYPSTLLYCYLAKCQGVKKVFVHSHSDCYGSAGIVHRFVSRLSRMLFLHCCDQYFAVSNQAGQFMFGNRHGFEVIKNGIDTAKFAFNKETRCTIRCRLQLSPETTLIGHVGRFATAKNHVFLIKVFAEYLRSNSDTRLILVGDGDLRESIINQINEEHIEDKVILYGTTDSVNELMQAMDVFLFPSLYEGLGIVAIEAQAAGLPVLMSDAVPKEASILPAVRRCALDRSPDEWACELAHIPILERTTQSAKEVCQSGYDINAVAKHLSDIYSRQ